MSRAIKPDLDSLYQFIDSYSMPRIDDNVEYKEQIKRLHKVYFSLLTMHSCIQAHDINSGTQHLTDQKMYLNESISELGSAFFISLHGCYKAAEQVLRSSLENFFKALACNKHPEILNSKSTYEVIDAAKTAEIFNVQSNEQKYNLLKQEYSLLCATVHTANSMHMQNVSAIGYFPHFNSGGANKFATHYLKIVKAFLELLCFEYKDAYLNAHYSNKDIINSCLPAGILDRLSNAVA